jgi:hypothetical protein
MVEIMVSRGASMRIIACFVMALSLVGCSIPPSLDDPKLSSKELNLEDFFDGKVTAYGQFQDVLGNVTRRFEVDIQGEMVGKTLTLVEDFAYSDGAIEQRIWTINKVGENEWIGTADGVIGTARGEESGDMFYWNYTIDLPVPDGEIRVRFDDYMWLLSDDRMLNKAYMSKYGVPIGEVTITFEKQ